MPQYAVYGATARPNKGILINDYSNGNDKIVARLGIGSVKALKGRKVGVEVGFVSYLLLIKALEANGMTEDDIVVVKIPTHQTPQVLISGDVDTIVAWQPHSGQTLKNGPEVRKIMSVRVGLSPEEYATFIAGTKFLTADGNMKTFEKAGNLMSVYGSSKIVDTFQVRNNIYDKPQDIGSYFDSALVTDGI